ncbi:MAG: ATP-binding protein [Candidatus Electrothrix scaldis]|nr:MAG: ATP-binding protein [Candidatus Electrothrix sp. GW3-3]
MKEIVILSGKGGVGKSSLTAALAHLLTENGKYRLTLADTDVDAPNLHIVLGAEFDRSTGVTASNKAIIDYDKCSRCMNCVSACAFDSIIGTEEPVIISYSCEGCGVCSLVCPEEAVSVHPVENGQINFVTSGTVRVVAGALGIGESSSGRLVDIVKRQARQEASLSGCDLLLTDGPPGIGCPVIAALKGADYAILVSEPTPSALSDLQRITEVVQGFKIPAGAVLNRSDMDPQSAQTTRDWLTGNELPLLGEIPYDPYLPQALARGNLGVKMYPDAPSSLAIKKLHKVVEGLLE